MTPEQEATLRDALIESGVESDPIPTEAAQAHAREKRFWRLRTVLVAECPELVDRPPEQVRGDLADDLAEIIRTGYASRRARDLVADFLRDALTDDAQIGRLLRVRTTGRPSTKRLREARCVVAFELALAAGKGEAAALQDAYDARKGEPGAYVRDSKRKRELHRGTRVVKTTEAKDYIERHVTPCLREAGLLPQRR